MDLKQVIAELRAELESIDQVMLALAKLAELRNRRTPAVFTGGSEKPVRRRRSKKTSGSRETATASAE